MVNEQGESKFNPETQIADSGDAFVIVGEDGLPREAGESGVILRGELAERYNDGETVSVPGIGETNNSDGIVLEGAATNPGRNVAPDSPAAASPTALRRGDVTQEQYDAAHGVTGAGGAVDAPQDNDAAPASKGNRSTRNKSAADDGGESSAEGTGEQSGE